MGEYLIPNATSLEEAEEWRGAQTRAGEAWELLPAGIRYSDPEITDAEAAARYASFLPRAFVIYVRSDWGDR